MIMEKTACAKIEEAVVQFAAEGSLVERRPY